MYTKILEKLLLDVQLCLYSKLFLGKDCPVDFDRVLSYVKAKHPYREEVALNAEQLRKATKAFLDTNGLDECKEDFKNEIW